MTTSTDTRKAWESVADHLEALGLKLELHVEQAEPSSGEIREAFDRLGSAIEATFSAIGASVADAADGLRCRHGRAQGEVTKGSTDKA